MQSNYQTVSPTLEAHGDLSSAFGFYNRELFAEQLPACLITQQRRARVLGYFTQDRFLHAANGLKVDEIAMNPSYFATASTTDVLSTLVHEMVHLWQRHFGTPGRARYHNRQWAEKMKSIGLHPSSTGTPGGSETGDIMDHYIVPAGAFDLATKSLLRSGFAISWFDRFPTTTDQTAPGRTDSPIMKRPDLDVILPIIEKSVQNRSNRIKYVCLSCHAAAWGKPALNLICGKCEKNFTAVFERN